jgi:VanZ family protein
MLYAPLIVWIGVILFLSSPEGSMTQTSRFIGPLFEFLFPSMSAERILEFHGYIRKLAHFTEYGILGYFAYRAFSVSIVRPRNWVAGALALAALIAVIDEFNQSFEPSRTGSPWDVFIDISGATSVLLLCFLWKRSVNRRPNDT